MFREDPSSWNIKCKADSNERWGWEENEARWQRASKPSLLKNLDFIPKAMDNHKICINNKWEKSQSHWLKQKGNYWHLRLNQGVELAFQRARIRGSDQPWGPAFAVSLSSAMFSSGSWFLPWAPRGSHRCSSLMSSQVQNQQILSQVIQAKALEPGLTWGTHPWITTLARGVKWDDLFMVRRHVASTDAHCPPHPPPQEGWDGGGGWHFLKENQRSVTIRMING